MDMYEELALQVVITSTKEVVFIVISLFLFSRITQKYSTDFHKI